jgi:hypothetical protein
MNYRKIHQFLLVAECSIAVICVGVGLYILGVLVQVSTAIVALALLWVGWELHRLVTEVRNSLQGFVEGYQESIAVRRNS